MPLSETCVPDLIYTILAAIQLSCFLWNCHTKTYTVFAKCIAAFLLTEYSSDVYTKVDFLLRAQLPAPLFMSHFSLFDSDLTRS